MSKWRTAGYVRLSRDDNYSDSVSIENQKSIIQNYIDKSNDSLLIDFYIDDGYSGTNFDRPGFERLMQDIIDEKINMIIIKDFSRLGRDHILVDNYLEKFFPGLGIRVVSINDNYDSLKVKGIMDNIGIPLTNLANDYMAYEISKKIKNTFDYKKNKGEHIGSSVPYGYKKDSKDNHYFKIDKEAADVVKSIFNMFLLGKTKTEIANILNEREIVNPATYKKEHNLGNTSCSTTKWDRKKIESILKNEVYTGVIIQNKFKSENYRTHKQVLNDEKDWIITDNHHKALVSKEIFEKVQLMMKSRNREKSNDSKDIFSGYLKCADCKSAMYLKPGKNKNYYYCGRNRTYGVCSNHSIREEYIKNELLEQLNLRNIEGKKFNKLTRNTIVKYVDNIYVNEDKTIEIVLKYENKI